LFIVICRTVKARRPRLLLDGWAPAWEDRVLWTGHCMNLRSSMWTEICDRPLNIAVRPIALTRKMKQTKQIFQSTCETCKSILWLKAQQQKIVLMYRWILLTVVSKMFIYYTLCLLQIVIASIMCSYIKDDWVELAKMAEVSIALRVHDQARNMCFKDTSRVFNTSLSCTLFGYSWRSLSSVLSLTWFIWFNIIYSI